jgi:hypothetical protein
MNLSKEIKAITPIKALNIIERHIDELSTPNIDSSPELIDSIKDEIIKFINALIYSEKANKGTTGKLSNNFISGKLLEGSEHFHNIAKAKKIAKENESGNPIDLYNYINPKPSIASLRETQDTIIKEKTAEELRALAQSIGCLTRQKDGDWYEPRAFKAKN